MIYCPSCNASDLTASECPTCGAAVVSTDAPEPSSDDWMRHRRRRHRRAVASIACGVGAALAYGTIVKTGPALPGVACAVLSLAAVVLAPA